MTWLIVGRDTTEMLLLSRNWLTGDTGFPAENDEMVDDAAYDGSTGPTTYVTRNVVDGRGEQ